MENIGYKYPHLHACVMLCVSAGVMFCVVCMTMRTPACVIKYDRCREQVI